ncbi:MAG: hypothetical protein O7E54_05990 [Planctomycetota bacterium]|nr:hypothetical protein [Planctomycetota bacterium]
MSFKKLSMFCLAAAIVAATGCKSSDAKKTGAAIAFVPIKVGTAADDVIRMVGKPLTKTPVVGGGVKWTYDESTHVVVESGKVVSSSAKGVAKVVTYDDKKGGCGCKSGCGCGG